MRTTAQRPKWVSLSRYARPVKRAAILIAYLAVLLALDHFASYPEQLGLGAVTWAVLIALAWRLPVAPAGARARRGLLRDDRRGHGLADLGRLPLPAAQPAALHSAGARARLPDGDRDRGGARAARAVARRHCRRRRRDLGDPRALRAPAAATSPARSACRCSSLFLWRSRNRAIYASVFLVVAALELYGTAIGTWRWAPTLPGLGIPDGNPPSGVASGYVWFDVMAMLAVTALIPIARRFRTASRPRAQLPRAPVPDR